MRCPVCKMKPIGTVDLEADLKAEMCSYCGGHWISRHNYDTLLTHHGETLPEKPFSEVKFDINDVQDVKTCPDCERVLLKYRVGHGLDFFVDHCSGCGGVWLDKNEWNALREKNLHDEIHRIFSTTWQSQVRTDQMRDTLDTIYANRFGSESYQKVKELREWVHNHPQKHNLISFISCENPYEP